MIIVVSIAGCGVSPLHGYYSYIPEETRAFWVERWHLNNPESINEIIDTAKRMNIDTLFVQINGTAEAYYQSDIVPKAQSIQKDFDPLEYFLKKAEQVGISVHAWINTYTMSYITTRPNNPQHIIYTSPHWVLRDAKGRSMLEYTEQDAISRNLFYITADPALEEVRQYYVNVITEIVDNYNVMGIHLDYIRYPGKDYGYYVNVIGSMQEDWKRLQVTTLVEDVYNSVKNKDPNTSVSAAVFADYWSAYNYYYQEWKEWVGRDILDFVVLMAYHPSPIEVEMQVAEAVRSLNSAQVYAGLGVYRMEGEVDSIIDHIARVRRAGASGVVLFSYGSLVGCENTIKSLRDGPFNLDDL